MKEITFLDFAPSAITLLTNLLTNDTPDRLVGKHFASINEASDEAREETSKKMQS